MNTPFKSSNQFQNNQAANSSLTLLDQPVLENISGGEVAVQLLTAPLPVEPSKMAG